MFAAPRALLLAAAAAAAVLLVLLVGAAAQDRVLLKDVTALTFRAGARTTGRRSSPIAQTRCRGKPCARYEPPVIQCLQSGWDGHDAAWRCEADLPARMRFGQVKVSCEGYSYSDDSYILAGSCGLTYQLVEGGAMPGGDDSDEGESTWGVSIFGLLLAGVVAFVVISSCCGSRWWRSTPGADDDSSPPPPYDSYHRMPSYGRSTMPSSCGPTAPSAAPSSSSSGPGFWSGLGVGAIAGYAFGHRHRGNHATAVPAGRWGWGRSPAAPSSSEPTRTAVGYATTERR